MTRPRAVRAPRRLFVDVTDGRRARAAYASLARWLERAAPRAAAGSVAIALISDRRMRALNRAYRGIDAATDVLSFPADGTMSRSDSHPTRPGPGGLPAGRVGPPPRRRQPAISADNWFESNHLGDMAIAIGVARRQARAEGHPLGTELKVLALHGLLHLLGYDHERDKGAMRRVEERLRRRAGLPAGLIVRSPRRTSY